MNHLFSLGLFIHIIGITFIAGGSVGGLVLEKQLWKYVHQSPEKVTALAPLMPKYPVIIQAGVLLMLISGLTMLGSLSWMVAAQWWFVIKMALVIALVLNGLLVARPNGLKLQALLPRLLKGEDVAEEIGKVKRKLTLFHITELSMLLVVYLLAVFRF